MKCILAIDQGTTGSRAVLYDRHGRKVAGAYREFAQHFPRPGWVEHDPREIWESVRWAVDSALGKAPGATVAAVGITNQRETTVVWDRVTGRPVHNAIVWQCRRTAERCRRLERERGMARSIRDRTGLPVDAYFSATKIEWILRFVPGAAAKARAGRLAFGTTDAWVLWNLTGGAVHATDPTNASRTMLYDIGRLCWDRRLLDIFSIPPAMMPRVMPSSGMFARTTRIGRLAAGIPIAGIAGDQQAALFGQACFEPGSVKNTYGTGSFILMNAGRRRPLSRSGLITTIGCGARGEVVYVLEGSVFIAGAAIQWLRDGLRVIRTAGESEHMARAVKDTGGVYFVPALVGLGAPYWDPLARGAIYGITRGTRASHIVRAAIEAMCYQTRDVLGAMRADAGFSVRSLKVDGGAVANGFLCQFQSDILGIEVVRPRVIEITSLGAAYLAGLAAGFWKDAAAIRACWKVGRVFRPRMARPRAASLYRGWQDAVRRTRTGT